MGQYKSQTSYSKRAHDHTFFLSKYATVENLIEIYISCPKNLVRYTNLVCYWNSYERICKIKIWISTHFGESKYCYQFWKGSTNMIKAFQLSRIYILSSYCHHGKTNVLYYRPMYSPPETRCHQKIMFFLVLVFSYLRFNVPNERMDTTHFNKRCA